KLALGGLTYGASHLPGLVSKAGEAAAGADARARGHRARRAVDRIIQSRDHNPGAAPRAHARGRFRSLRVRSRRLTTHSPPACDSKEAGQAAPRANVVFEGIR